MVESCALDTATGRRDRAVLLLLARMGLRAGEAAGLRLDDIDWRAGEITVRGKGSRHERLPLRAYAAEQARATDDEQPRHAAIRRVLDHYLHAAHSADRLLNPARDQITVAPCADRVRPERLAGYGQAMAWFRAEHKVLLAVLALAVDAGCDTHAWQLPWTMMDFCEFSGRWHDWIATQRIAIAATRRLGHRAAEARCCRALGYAYA